MESNSYSVTDLSADQRHAFEGVLGQPLREDQRVIVQLVDTKAPESADQSPAEGRNETAKSVDVGILPDWCAIFADLSDEEFAEIEAAILTRADLSRSFDLDD
ncbi:MAG: hypothetical protein WD971_02010 [Pirellulales bacterium]